MNAGQPGTRAGAVSFAVLAESPLFLYSFLGKYMENHMSQRTYAVIGLGAMGMGLAQSLLRAGLKTVGCDVNPAARSKPPPVR